MPRNAVTQSGFFDASSYANTIDNLWANVVSQDPTVKKYVGRDDIASLFTPDDWRALKERRDIDTTREFRKAPRTGSNRITTETQTPPLSITDKAVIAGVALSIGVAASAIGRLFQAKAWRMTLQFGGAFVIIIITITIILWLIEFVAGIENALRNAARDAKALAGSLVTVLPPYIVDQTSHYTLPACGMLDPTPKPSLVDGWQSIDEAKAMAANYEGCEGDIAWLAGSCHSITGKLYVEKKEYDIPPPGIPPIIFPVWRHQFLANVLPKVLTGAEAEAAGGIWKYLGIKLSFIAYEDDTVQFDREMVHAPTVFEQPANFDSAKGAKVEVLVYSTAIFPWTVPARDENCPQNLQLPWVPNPAFKAYLVSGPTAATVAVNRIKFGYKFKAAGIYTILYMVKLSDRYQAIGTPEILLVLPKGAVLPPTWMFEGPIGGYAQQPLHFSVTIRDGDLKPVKNNGVQVFADAKLIGAGTTDDSGRLAVTATFDQGAHQLTAKTKVAGVDAVGVPYGILVIGVPTLIRDLDSSPCAVLLEGDKVKLTGRVTTWNDTPVGGVEVKLRTIVPAYADKPTTPATIRTDAEGKFALEFEVTELVTPVGTPFLPYIIQPYVPTQGPWAGSLAFPRGYFEFPKGTLLFQDPASGDIYNDRGWLDDVLCGRLRPGAPGVWEKVAKDFEEWTKKTREWFDTNPWAYWVFGGAGAAAGVAVPAGVWAANEERKKKGEKPWY